MFIQSKVLHCEHVFDLFFSLFSLLQNKGFIDVNVHANGYTILLFVYLIQNIFQSTNKIRCVHDFCRKHLQTSLLPYHQKKESLSLFFLNKKPSSLIVAPICAHEEQEQEHEKNKIFCNTSLLPYVFLHFFQANFFYAFLCKYFL